MKRATFIPLYIAAHIIGVVLHIHKHTLFIKESYTKQKNETLKSELIHKQQQITHQLYSLRDYAHISSYARTALHMQPIHINQIKKLSSL